MQATQRGGVGNQERSNIGLLTHPLIMADQQQYSINQKYLELQYKHCIQNPLQSLMFMHGFIIFSLSKV